MRILPASPWSHRSPSCATWPLTRRVDSDSDAWPVGWPRAGHEIPERIQHDELGAHRSQHHERHRAACIVAPCLNTEMSRQVQGAVQMVALRHDDEAFLAVDVARADDRGDGTKTREIAIDHVRRHAARDQDVTHDRRLVVAVAITVAANDQVLDLARPPQIDGGIEAVSQTPA